ncbi:hypothetical protein [Kitasatospora sp. NPDC057936]|uniref:hypothetical protein n=1 Tax=Kitasatospora sp. NPDC057936 TaxID=3346283 RepID=UPI0036DEF7BC
MKTKTITLWWGPRPGPTPGAHARGPHPARHTFQRRYGLTGPKPGTWLPEQDDTAWRTASAERRTFAALFWHPYYGERRCELTFTGIDLDVPSLHERLNDCLLTDAELVLGMEHWQLSDDPFAAALDTDPPSP